MKTSVKVPRKSPYEKVLQKLEVCEQSGCWLFKGALTETGYGFIRIDTKKVRAHRISYEHYFGSIPEGLVVCHKCDVRNCCNPAHLFAGTQGDNMADQIKKGRGPDRSGERNGFSKLKTEDVAAIRSASGSISGIARQFGISRRQISQIRNGTSWTKQAHAA